MAQARGVRGQEYLFQRGGRFYFRRAVPPHLREAFGGKTEVVISLRTGSKVEARSRLAAHLDAFERTKSQAEGRPDPTVNPLPPVAPPAKADIEMAVRDWLTARMGRTGFIDRTEPGTVEQSLRTQAQIAETVKRGLSEGRNDPPLMTEWIAYEINRQNGWQLPAGSPAYQHLLRVVGLGQIETTLRNQEDLDGFSLVTGHHPLFGPDRFVQDRDRRAEKHFAPITLVELFDAYAAEVKPRPATVKSFRQKVQHLANFLGNDDAHAVTAEQILQWKDMLLNERDGEGRPVKTARTVRDTYLAAAKVAFVWGVENRRVRHDPTHGVRVRVPKQVVLRERALTRDEALTILRAASASSVGAAHTIEARLARRWVPWICAYSGARVNEITQLRAEDVVEVEGVWCLRITPEAGSVKNNQFRLVPLHSHLIEQGFLKEMEGRRGPIFYDPTRHRGGSAGNPQYKKVGERLARWVRELGVDDPRVAPNHGWRHRFKDEARIVGMDTEARDMIAGHALSTEGAKYGGRPIAFLAREIEKLTRYDLCPR